MRMGIWAAAAAVFCISGALADDCPGPSTLTVNGTIHKISTMREEPQALPETFFTIALAKSICGKSEITANTIGAIPCAEGDAVEAKGEFSPPSQLTGVARLKVREMPICKAAK